MCYIHAKFILEVIHYFPSFRISDSQISHMFLCTREVSLIPPHHSTPWEALGFLFSLVCHHHPLLKAF